MVSGSSAPRGTTGFFFPGPATAFLFAAACPRGGGMLSARVVGFSHSPSLRRGSTTLLMHEW